MQKDKNYKKKKKKKKKSAFYDQFEIHNREATEI